MEREKPTFDILGRIEHHLNMAEKKSSAECCFYRENLCRLRHYPLSVLSGGGLSLSDEGAKEAS